MPEHKKAPPRPRPFWSGTITFGLINLPVSLFAANRSSRVRLRMVDDDGVPLTRRYFCPHHEQALTADEIVRGFEVEDERFVVVEDDELDAVAPEKSRDINLREFVALSDIDPMYFNRSYFLAPDKGAARAYQLLAQTMEDEQRAGIATFVMRGKGHFVAIMAEKGILRAETLHFHDELRSPDDIGLPAKQQGNKTRVRHFKKCMNSHTRKALEPAHLSDRHSEAIRKRIDKKLKAGEDIVAAPDAAKSDDDAATTDSAADLMQALKNSLENDDKPAADQNTKGNGQPKRRAKKTSSRAKQDNGASDDQAALDSLSKKELYELAQKRGVAGRSNMTKAELVRSIDNGG